MGSPKEEYNKRKKYYEGLLKKQNNKIRFISNLRLLVFLAGVVLALYFYIIKSYYIGALTALIFLCSFIYLVIKHNKIIEQKSYSEALYNINDSSIKRIHGDWKSFKDSGEEFIDDEHEYSKDLDIFGRGSLFQWINTTVTYLGRQKLKSVLENPYKSADEIRERQEGISELADDLDWRQEFISEALVTPNSVKDIQELLEWSRNTKSFYKRFSILVVARVIPVFTVIIVSLPFVNRNIPYYIPTIAIAINILILMWKNEERTNTLVKVDKYKESIRAYYGMLKILEKRQFKSKYLKNIKSNIISNNGLTSSIQIKKLASISDMINNRKNQYYIIMNILLLWDYQCMIALEKWKNESGRHLQNWLEAIGNIEELISLSNIKYDNEEWVMPKIAEGISILSAEEMGHPLLTGDRITNSFKMGKIDPILLITGSNMSGKSTLLRTAGINLVLSYIGAPVFAKSFTCSIMNIYTCMRVSDDLEKSVSSFYAELLRIKKIVEATKKDEQIFFLLDEIFKGTNSMDRHIGAKVLIESMRKFGELGMVSTHDLELGELEKESGGKVKNYHFREYYKNNEIYFDYKLRPGVSTTRNALYLIKMVGIDVDIN